MVSGVSGFVPPGAAAESQEDILPPHLLIKIFEFLGAQAQARASQVCRSWHHLYQATTIKKSIDFGKFIHFCHMSRFYGLIDNAGFKCEGNILQKDLDSRTTFTEWLDTFAPSTIQGLINKVKVYIAWGQPEKALELMFTCTNTIKVQNLIFDSDIGYDPYAEGQGERIFFDDVTRLANYYLNFGEIETCCELITQRIASPIDQLEALRTVEIENRLTPAAIEHYKTLIVTVNQLAAKHEENAVVQENARESAVWLRFRLMPIYLAHDNYDAAAKELHLLDFSSDAHNIASVTLFNLGLKSIEKRRFDIVESCLKRLANQNLEMYNSLQHKLYWKKFHPSSIPAAFIDSLDIYNKITHFKRLVSADINADEALAQFVVLVESLDAGERKVRHLIWLGEVLAKKGVENSFEQAKAVARGFALIEKAKQMSLIAQAESKYNMQAARVTREEALADAPDASNKALILAALGRFAEATAIADRVFAFDLRANTYLRIIQIYAEQKGI